MNEKSQITEQSRHYLDDIPLCPGRLCKSLGMSDIATHSIRQADLKITGTAASDTRNGNAKYKFVEELGHLLLH
jgi:hypothetical protein